MIPTNRHIGFISMVLLGINGIIGSGIFLLPGTVMKIVGHWSIAVYLFVTLLVLSIAWCFGQCASLFDRSGGAYVYAKEAFGDFIGFEIGLMRWVVGTIGWAAIVMGFITALSSLWPQALQEPMRSILIVSIIGILSLLNMVGVSIFRYLNNLITVTKIVPLLLFIGIGFFYMEPANYPELKLTEFEFHSFSAATLIIFYAFSGFETLVVAAGEMKNPEKNLPLAMMLVIGFCSSLYFSVQFVSMGLLGTDLVGHLNPMAGAAELLIGEIGLWVVSLAMLISIGGIAVSASFITPRSAVALADDQMIPGWIAKRGRFDTPVAAICLTMVMTIGVALSGSFAQLAAISVVARFVQYISTCLATIVLHRRLPRDNQTPLKRVQLLIVPIFALIGIGALLWQATLIQLVSGLSALILGLPLYFFSQKRLAISES